MKTFCCLIIAFAFATLPAWAQDTLLIWQGQTPPHYKSNTLHEYEKDMYGTTVVLDITQPTLTVFPASGQATGQAVIILPGGGYQFEAAYHEGYDVARYLAAQGIAGAVLKYRLPNPASSDAPEQVPLADVHQALKLLRQHAEDYDIDTSKIGVMGFSAGSHLATLACLWRSNDADENPNFGALIYGVTLLTPDNREWLEQHMYFRPMTDEEAANNNLVDLVDENTPPAFLVHAYDDPICNPNETLDYAAQLRAHGVPAEMHIFPTGGHGFGMGRKSNGTAQWPALFVNWLNRLK